MFVCSFRYSPEAMGPCQGHPDGELRAKYCNSQTQAHARAAEDTSHAHMLAQGETLQSLAKAEDKATGWLR